MIRDNMENTENTENKNSTESNDDEYRAKEDAPAHGATEVKVVAHNAQSEIDLKTLADILGIDMEKLKALSSGKLKELANKIKSAGAGRGM